MPPENKSSPPNFTDFWAWLGYHLTKDWLLMTKAPIAFFAVLVFSLAASWLLTWQAVVPEKNEQLNTKQIHIDYLSKQLDEAQRENEKLQSKVSTFESTIKTSLSQTLQVVNYINDPNAEKLVPSNINEPAFAYSDDGAKPLFTWSIKSQSWK
jgi:hypothetical protein